jgi:hypothetical protein
MAVMLNWHTLYISCLKRRAVHDPRGRCIDLRRLGARYCVVSRKRATHTRYIIYMYIKWQDWSHMSPRRFALSTGGRPYLVMVLCTLLQCCHGVVQLSYPVMCPPLHLLSESEWLARVLYYPCVCLLEFCELFLRCRSISLGVYGILLCFLGGYLELRPLGIWCASYLRRPYLFPSILIPWRSLLVIGRTHISS